MPVVVVDTNISLPATLTPTGLTRKFWILLAFGAATYRAEHLQRELDALEQDTADVRGAIVGHNGLERLVVQARRTRTAIEELLPLDAPSNWVAIGGVDLFSEYERKVGVVAAKLGVAPAPDPASARRHIEAVCVAAEPAFDSTQVPSLTSNPDDDLIVWTALQAGADLLISDDKDIVPADEGGSCLYEHGGRSVLAVRFGRLVQTHLHGVDWNQIDGTLLPEI
jgi:predicted nucleic acid-binding protein